jgi:hypothetical protein
VWLPQDWRVPDNHHYATDVSDAAWALLAPLLPAAQPGERPRTTDIRAVINAIFYLWFAKIRSARNRLTCGVTDGKKRRHATAFTVRVSIRPLAPQRTSGRCDRERSAPNADSGVSTKTEAPSADDLGSDILSRSPQRVVRLATSLALVQADTVVPWQRERFRKFWARLSNPQRQRRGRPAQRRTPPIAPEEDRGTKRRAPFRQR